MPDMPPRFGARSRQTANRSYDRQRRALSATRPLYGTARWQAIRDDQLAREPFCRFCLEAGEPVDATVCDHVEPHRGDVEKFWAGPFQSLCEPCHNSTKQAAEATDRPGGRGVKSLGPPRS